MTETFARIRPATPEDATSLAALSIEVWLGTYLPAGVPTSFAAFALEAFSPKAMARALSAPTARFFLAESTDAQVSPELHGPLGYIRVDTESPAPEGAAASVEIATLYVQPRHHGKGMGRALLAHALADLAGDFGNQPVWLRCSVENPNAMGFYIAQGFTDQGRADFELDGKSYENRLLIRDLSWRRP